MKRLILTLLALFICAAPSLAGWRYSATYQYGFQYYAKTCYSPAGYYAYYATPTYQPVYYPVYSVSYSEARAKELELMAQMTKILGQVLERQGNGNGHPAVQTAAPLRDGPSILAARCASCHTAGVVEAKGSKLTLLTQDGKPADITLSDKRNVVKRVYEIDPSKCMPPGKPLVREEREALAAWLGIQVVEK